MITLPKNWIFCPKPKPQARLRLICFAYAGGSAAVFRTWPNDLPDDIEMWAIRLPGRESQLAVPPFTQIPALINALAEHVAPHLDQPFAFFGHSLGAILAFEFIRKLRQTGRPQPRHLFVSAHNAPQVRRPNSPLHHLPDAQFITAVQNGYNGIPQAVLNEPELMRMLLPALRADFQMVETYTYQPQPPLTCPISAFYGQADPETTIPHIDAWRIQTTAQFKVRDYPGGHFFLQPCQSEIVQAIVEDLG